jgi:hypothetical protein
MITNAKLTNLQLELIKMFSFQLNDTQLLEIRDILTKYFADKATNEMDKLWLNNKWSDETMENWANEHLRTTYKD